MDFGPEGFEVRVVEGEGLDLGFASDLDGFGEPGSSFIHVPEAALITGEVIGDGADVGEKRGGGQEFFESFVGALKFVEAVGVVDPADGGVGCDFDESKGDGEGAGPIAFGGAQFPMSFKDGRVIPVVGVNSIQFDAGVGRTAEIEPA